MVAGLLVAVTRDRRRGRWDVRVVYLEQRGRWWWRAYEHPAGPELFGFTTSPDQAWKALNAAIIATEEARQQPPAGGPAT